MATIFYGVQGEGLGHATRSKTIIEHLRKKNEVVIFCGGRAYQYLTKHFTDVRRITSPHIVYTGNSASNTKTFFLNLGKIPKFIASFFHVRFLGRKFKPDIIITDFEPVIDYYGWLSGIPVISIDNQHVIAKSEIAYPQDKAWQYIKTMAVIKMMVPKADMYFMINYFFPPLNCSNCEYVKPIIRDEMLRLRPKSKDFVLVYQTSFTDTKLIPALAECEEKIVVYGYTGKLSVKNVELREFNERDFFNDFKNCKAVITNGGQSLICEALFLGKPVLSVPIRNQFEQYINASYLQNLGFGEFHDNIDASIIKSFLLKTQEYGKNIRKHKMVGNKHLFTKLDSAIKKLAGKEK